MESTFKLTPKKQEDAGKWTVIEWDNLTDESIANIVIERLRQSKNHEKRKNKEDVWSDCYKYYRGEYLEDEDKLINMTLFSIVEAKLAKMYRMMFHEQPFIRVFPDDPNTNTEQSEKIELLFHHQIQENNPRHFLSMWLKQGMVYGTNILKVGWQVEKKTVINRNIYEDKSFVTPSNLEIGRPYFTVPDIFDVYPDMDAKTPNDITYVVEIQRRRLSQILNSEDTYTNLDKLIGATSSGKADKKTTDLIKKNFSRSAQSENADDKPYDGSDYTEDQYDPIVELAVYYEKDRLIVVANGSVVLRNTPSPHWYKGIPFIFSQHYLDFENVYGIGDVEPNMVLTEAEDILTNMLFDYSKVGLRKKFLIPETLSIDEEALANSDNTAVYCENPEAVKELQSPNINFGSGAALIDSYKGKQEESSAMTPYQKGTPVSQETAAGVYSIQEAGNIRFLYNVDQYEPALVKLAIWFKELNYQYMPNKKEIEKRNNIGEEDWVILTPEDLKGRFKYTFIGSANAENKDMQYNKLLQIYGLLSNRPDIDQDYLLETLVKKSNIFDNPEKLINSQGTSGVDRIAQQLQMQEGGGMQAEGSPPVDIPSGTPQEMSRLRRSEVNNPNNRFNGGIK